MTTNAKKVNASKLQQTVLSAIQKRVDSAENDNQAKNLRAELKMLTLPVIEHAAQNGIDFNALSKIIEITDKKDANYLAVYALQKVRKTLVACAQGLARTLDPYTRTIVANLIHDAQNNKTALVSLSRSISFDEFDNQKTIKERYNCNASTAGTQMSSTRQALRVLNIATVTKNRNNDEFALNEESPLTVRLREMFTVKSV